MYTSGEKNIKNLKECSANITIGSVQKFKLTERAINAQGYFLWEAPLGVKCHVTSIAEKILPYEIFPPKLVWNVFLKNKKKKIAKEIICKNDEPNS